MSRRYRPMNDYEHHANLTRRFDWERVLRPLNAEIRRTKKKLRMWGEHAPPDVYAEYIEILERYKELFVEYKHKRLFVSQAQEQFEQAIGRPLPSTSRELWMDWLPEKIKQRLNQRLIALGEPPPFEKGEK